MVSQPKPHRFSVAEYDRMVERGVFPEDARLELIDGEVIEMSPIGDRHVQIVRRLHQDVFFPLVAGRLATLDTQSPIRLRDRHEPPPDLVRLRPEVDGDAGLGAAEDVLLVVEVTDTTLEHDRRKALFYAADGAIPEYWLINVGSEPATIAVYRDPQSDGCRTVRVVRPGDPLAPLAFPDLAIDTAALLG